MAGCPADRNSATAPRLETGLAVVALLRRGDLALPLVVRHCRRDYSRALRGGGSAFWREQPADFEAAELQRRQAGAPPDEKQIEPRRG